MKRFLTTFLILISFSSYSQEWIDDSNFDKKIHASDAFGDDETVITVVEFWVEFNKDNAFKDWDKVKGVEYYRVDIEKAPNAKKEYRIRMAPTIIIFKNGSKEESFKAGLDLECPVDLDELQESIEDVKQASKF